MATTAPPLAVWRIWLLAARPATLPAAVVPVVVGTAAAVPITQVRIGPFIAALFAALLIQIGTNLANDVFDFHKGADTAARLGPRRVTQSGMVAPERVLVGTYVTFGIAALIGIYLVLVGGWPILAVGILSILSGLAYTGGPWPLGYRGLGDVFVFVFFGVAAVTGSAYLQVLSLSTVALIASIPVGLLVTAILIVNNLRDIETDRASGKRTLAVRLGRSLTRWQYALFVLGAYIFPVVLAVVEQSAWWTPMLPLATMPLAIRLIRTVLKGAEGPTLNRILKQTGQLHLLFGLLFAASLWL